MQDIDLQSKMKEIEKSKVLQPMTQRGSLMCSKKNVTIKEVEDS